MRIIIILSALFLTACATSPVASQSRIDRINAEVARDMGLRVVPPPIVRYNPSLPRGEARYNRKTRTATFSSRVGDHHIYHELVHHYQGAYGIKYPHIATAPKQAKLKRGS